jgi:HEAT repeat protein
MPLIRKTPSVPAALQSASPRQPGPDALTRGSDDERWAAARAAADRPDQVQALAEALLREPNARVREAMFTSLTRIGTAQSAEALVPLLRSDDSALRTGALDALRAMKSVIRPYVAQLIRDPESDVRLLACELARALPGDEGTGLLCALLELEREPNVCASAIEVLAEVGGPDALPALQRCEQRFRDTPFLVFAISVAADRIRSQSPVQRG